MSNSLATSYGVGTVIPGEGALVIGPKFPPPARMPGVQFVHGAGSDATYCISTAGDQATLTQMIAAAGFSGYSGDNGGPNTWGNTTALSRVSSGRNFMQGLPAVKSGKIALVSASMGGLNAFAWAAANPDKVSCIVSVIPVINLSDIHTNDRGGFTSAINAAYSGGYTEATYGAVHNPRTLAAAGKFAGIPILIFYGLTDDICLPGEAEDFAAGVGENVTLVPLASGHDFDSYAAVDQPMIRDFLLEHAR